MNGYDLIRPLLFRLDAEKVHHLTLSLLKFGMVLPGSSQLFERVAAPVEVMGIAFPNAVGLAAGMDKNGEFIVPLAKLGFGFIEVGTVTPRPQGGNPLPRLFRIPEHQAVINRMGFNNLGVDVLVNNVRRSGFKGVLGINFGANKDTPEERRIEDYVACLDKVYDLASYLVVNISSPNTPGLRNLQQRELLAPLLSALRDRRRALRDRHRKEVPLAVKVAPDLTAEQVDDLAALFAEFEVSGVIATNTTIARPGVQDSPIHTETGGLSGTPVLQMSLDIVRRLRRSLPDAIPVIGCGGILSGADALEFKRAGAICVQLYTGLVYRGPALVSEVARAWKEPDPRAH